MLINESLQHKMAIGSAFVNLLGENSSREMGALFVGDSLGVHHIWGVD